MKDSSFAVVRLNRDLFPITPYEASKYADLGMVPQQVEPESQADLKKAVSEADAVMVVSEALSTGIIDSMTRCRVICRLGAGTDKLDVDRATQHGIVIANVPDFCWEEQADHAFALLLSVARRLNTMHRCMQKGQYVEARQICSPLRRLPGRTLGLVGWGGSAKAMARRARGFDLHVLATRQHLDRKDPEMKGLGVTQVSLDQLLNDSDYVSLHLPLNKMTFQLFDKRRLLDMRPGSILINTARGAIVDEDALVEVLSSGHLAGAGLDVFEQIPIHELESSAASHPLLDMENVVCTPHVAAYSADAMCQVGEGAVDNLRCVLSGRWPRPDRVVNPQVIPRFPLTSYREELS